MANRTLGGGLVTVTFSFLIAACAARTLEFTSDSGGTSGGTSSGGTSNEASSSPVAGAGPILKVDNWVPPAVVEGPCSAPADADLPEDVTALNRIGCRTDFDLLTQASLTAPADATSVMVVLDRENGDALYFPNGKLYSSHWEFANTQLSTAAGFSNVGSLAQFNETAYSAATRRFLLAAVTYYPRPNYWALEFAPYDTASQAMLEKLFRAAKAKSYFGDALVFHPTSDLLETVAATLPADIHVKTTQQILAGYDYLPLNVGEAIGRLTFINSQDVGSSEIGFRDIVVLDTALADIPITAGIITEQIQTPLSDLNVWAVHRGTPNMSLRGATTNPALRALSGKWIRLTVGATEWSAVAVTPAEADAWLTAHAPLPIVVAPPDLSVTDLRTIRSVTDETSSQSLRTAIRGAVGAFGAKAAHYSVLANTSGVPVKDAFAIPFHYYYQFMEENGLLAQARAMLADPIFVSSLETQQVRLAELRNAIVNGQVNESFQEALRATLNAAFPGQNLRFTSSTNAESLDGFACTNCYGWKAASTNDWASVLAALKENWASVWTYRNFQERAYRSIDHMSVGMALLVHTNSSVVALGSAVTNNAAVPSGVDPAFWVTVQLDTSTTATLPTNLISDSYLHYFDQPGQPITWFSHSNAIPEGQTVLTENQRNALAVVLRQIHNRFSFAYGPGAGNQGWYAMTVNFELTKAQDSTATPTMFINLAEPYSDQ